MVIFNSFLTAERQTGTSEESCALCLGRKSDGMCFSPGLEFEVSGVFLKQGKPVPKWDVSLCYAFCSCTACLSTGPCRTIVFNMVFTLRCEGCLCPSPAGSN